MRNNTKRNNDTFKKITLFCIILACITVSTLLTGCAPQIGAAHNYRYVQLPADLPVGSEGDLLVIQYHTADTLVIGYWEPEGEAHVHLDDNRLKAGADTVVLK